jgi:hypothetical protein
MRVSSPLGTIKKDHLVMNNSEKKFPDWYLVAFTGKKIRQKGAFLDAIDLVAITMRSLNVTITSRYIPQNWKERTAQRSSERAPFGFGLWSNSERK